MNIIVEKALEPLKLRLENAFTANRKLAAGFSDMEITIGRPAVDSRFSTPAHAIKMPNYVGDAHMRYSARDRSKLLVRPSPFVGDMISSDALIALSKAKPKDVIMRPVYNEHTRKYDMVAMRTRDMVKSMVMDGIYDAAPDLMLTQQLSPWNVSWYEKIIKKPLLYSHALEACEVFTGTNPWAEAMNVQLADYAGFGVFEHSGGIENTLDQPLNVSAYLMSSLIFNITASYNLSLEELKRSEESSSPFGQQLITTKEEYAAYAIKMITDYLCIYGDALTAINGFLQIGSGVQSWPGTSNWGYVQAAGAIIGSSIYQNLIALVEPFLTQNWNKLDEVILMVSPKNDNLLRSYPYSQAYNPESAVQAWIDNFAAGMGEKGNAPKFRIVSEPLLGATNAAVPTNPFNAQTYDYSILVGPRIHGGPEEDVEPLVLAGMPLKDFSYPVIPGGYASQYKFLRRWAGLFFPVPSAIQVWSGFGMKSATT